MNRRTFLKTAAIPLIAALPATAEQLPEVFKTGFPTLDKLIGGGIRPGSLTIIAGPPRSGKTAFLEKIYSSQGFGSLECQEFNALILHNKYAFYFKSINHMKNLSTHINKNKSAIIITVPCNRTAIAENNCLPGGFSPLQFYADTCIILEPEEWSGSKVIVTKNRTGPIGKFKIRFNIHDGAYEWPC